MCFCLSTQDLYVVYFAHLVEINPMDAIVLKLFYLVYLGKWWKSLQGHGSMVMGLHLVEMSGGGKTR